MGEAEQQQRFARALQEAMDARGMSARQLAIKLHTDPRKIARYLKAKGLPNLYEAGAIARALRVDEDLFKNPPEVPPPPPKPYYPIEKYLLGGAVDLTPAIESGEREGLRRLRSPKPGAAAQPVRSQPRRARAG